MRQFIVTQLLSVFAREAQHCMCCQQPSDRLICSVCMSCVEGFSEKNNNSFINLRPDIAKKLPGLKCHAICAAGPHKGVLSDLISQFKYGKQQLLAIPLVSLLHKVITDSYRCDALPELIIPVPMHPIKRMIRGFNQTELLTSEISSQTGISTSSEALGRCRYLQPQAGKTGKQRRNVQPTIFAVNDSEMIKQLTHIAIIDDVITTGSTMEQLIKTIKKVNPDIRIDLWSLSISI